jgi:hypothetical protein
MTTTNFHMGQRSFINLGEFGSLHKRIIKFIGGTNWLTRSKKISTICKKLGSPSEADELIGRQVAAARDHCGKGIR